MVEAVGVVQGEGAAPRAASAGDGCAAGLRTVYTAPTVAAAEARFAEFADAWRTKYPAMVGMWERSWPEFVGFLEFPAEIRGLIGSVASGVTGQA